MEEGAQACTDTGSVPLALRKTPRAHAGVNMFIRNEIGCPLSPLARPKESATPKKRPASALANVTPVNQITAGFATTKKKRKNEGKDYDAFCWICHKDGKTARCQVCPRSYHNKCLSLEENQRDDWVCPECEKAMLNENVDTRSKAMKMLNVDQLCILLKFTVNRIKHQSDEAFWKPVSLEQFPNYTEYIFNPMDLSTLEKNIKKKMYGCTESFLADIKWILHNCIIFNGYQHRLTACAKSLLKLCKQELNEIEICPDCHLNAYTKKDNWFCEPCREPHILIWAKVKGYPFWPAKAMRILNGNVDVRFFGAHDRAWIPLNQCYLLSAESPIPIKNKKKVSFEQSMEELELHLKKLRDRFGSFQHAAFRTRLDSENLNRHLSVLFPQLKNDFLTINQTALKKPQIASGSGNIKGVSSKRSPACNAAAAAASAAACEIEKNSNFSNGVNRNTEGNEPTDNEFSCFQLRIPRLDLRKIPKPHLESVKKLESTIERIKENVFEKSDDDMELDDIVKESENTSAANDGLSNDSMKTSEDTLQSMDIEICDTLDCTCVSDCICASDSEKRLSQSCEVTSTTSTSEHIAAAARKAKMNDDAASLNPIKKSNASAQKLDQIIETCKAKVGFNETDEENHNTDESSDDEQNSGSNGKSSDLTIEISKESSQISETTSEIDLQENVLPVRETILPEETDMLDEASQRNEGDTNAEETLLAGDGSDGTKSRISPTRQSRGANENNANGLLESCSDTANKEDEDLCSANGNLIIDLDAAGLTENVDNTLKTKISEFVTQNILAHDADNRPPQSCSRNSTDDTRENNNSPCCSETIETSQELDDLTQNQKRPITVINISSSPPRMVPKPLPILKPKPMMSPQPLPPPSNPGPGCDMTKYSRKMMDFMRGTVEEIFRDMAKSGNLEASEKLKQLEIEKLQWRHQQELAEIKHNTDLILLEMRASMESEKQRANAETRKQCDIEKQKAVEEAKKKQWCSNCGKEAIFYCCWNTSYCDYPCQQAHWPQHMSTCTQSQGNNDADVREAPNEMITTPLTNLQLSKLASTSIANQSLKSITHAPTETLVSRNMSLQQVPISQPTSLNNQYSSTLGPSVQYIPSNAVQVIPQTSSLANSAALQVQYVTNIASQVSHSSTMPTPTSSTFAGMPAGNTISVQQAINSQSQNQRMFSQNQQVHRSIQMSNPIYPIIIQPSSLGLSHPSQSSATGRLYPRGPYIPGKPYHMS